MSTTSMNISLPESLKDFVKDRVEEEHYSNPSDYVRALIREDQKRRDEKKLEEMLLAGIRSGSRELTRKDWEKLKEDILARIPR
jgi:antitoxin ParD1/3/4